MAFHNGGQFSTWDKDNDKVFGQSCVKNCGRGAWWHTKCCQSSLNGIYSRIYEVEEFGIAWNSSSAMKATEMMIKRK